jgi:mannose-6-phosphate isomerase-like protein (cupin superfamily)
MTNTLSCGSVDGKNWGTTCCIFTSNDCECWSLNIKRGGYCSRHRHKNKWNRFLVVSGKLLVKIFRPDGISDDTILTDGMCTDVCPGIEHMFEAFEDTKCIEIYWVSIDPDDIERSTVGGIRAKS